MPGLRGVNPGQHDNMHLQLFKHLIITMSLKGPGQTLPSTSFAKSEIA